ncbi:TetR/AcrR family transcriptional regulator [Nocardioides dongxiaopingii]|uniref:TetR/AcrR family transcriptional regulator n=1 Tax=Nocardioides dongxiaopingii TaxID=2576036 RepID=UPI0010C76457|nr:TetR/AcrR family transcriptional regulator [Nocardioides dongxiaopingii]
MPTQVERRAATISRLLDATEVVVHERGYADTTIAAVCAEAGVSQGGLFRHFPHRRALLVATASRVAERQTDDVPAGLGLLESLRHLRALVRSRPNQVWHELVRAARTDAELRADLAPALREYHRRTGSAVVAMTPADRPWTPAHQAALRVVVNYLDGEAAVAHVLPDPDRDEASLRALADLLRPLLEETP